MLIGYADSCIVVQNGETEMELDRPMKTKETCNYVLHGDQQEDTSMEEMSISQP